MDCRCKKTLVPRCHTCRTAMFKLPLAKMRHKRKSFRHVQGVAIAYTTAQFDKRASSKSHWSAGYKIGYENKCGLADNRRPGDIIVYNWWRNRHLLIDVFVTNSLASHNVNAVLRSRPGGEAEATERTRRTNYRDIDASKYITTPSSLKHAVLLENQHCNFARN